MSGAAAIGESSDAEALTPDVLRALIRDEFEHMLGSHGEHGSHEGKTVR